MIRRWAIRLLFTAVALLAIALSIEFLLEARDAARYTAGESFAEIGHASIRYRLLGADRPGATVVILVGLGGSIEQMNSLQSEVSSEVPSLTYDRAGYGFSRHSTAHSAGEQADELAALLLALKIDKPVVLVAFSDSNQVARVFTGRYPEKTAGIYLIDPWMPEMDVIYRHDARRVFLRWIINGLAASSVGYTRLSQRLHSWKGPDSVIEQRAEAILARRSHYWAMAQEWYATPVSAEQTRKAPMPRALPLMVAFPKADTENETIKVLSDLRAGLVARSTCGTLVELQDVDHSLLIKPGPALDRIVAGIEQLSLRASCDD